MRGLHAFVIADNGDRFFSLHNWFARHTTGGLSDVGRHAIIAALEKPTINKIVVITEYPELLDLKNWECNCSGGHINPFNNPDSSSRLEMVKIDTWKNDQPELAKHFDGAVGVVSCLGHRQPGWKNSDLKKRGLVAHAGNKQVIAAMMASKVDRVVVISSIALNGDKSWPHWASKVMGCLFATFQRSAAKDLIGMEAEYVESSGHYYLQQPGEKKSLDVTSGTMMDGEVGGNMAKIDVARFMVDEVIHPTLHRKSQTVGAKPGTPMNG